MKAKKSQRQNHHLTQKNVIGTTLEANIPIQSVFQVS